MYLLCCPDSTKLIVLMRFGDTEEGNDSIADILFDEAVISVNDLGNFSEDPARDLPDLLGVELLCHGGVAREIGKEDGDVLALRRGDRFSLFLYRRGGLKDLAALAAEFLSKRNPCVAAGADEFHLCSALSRKTSFLRDSRTGT